MYYESELYHHGIKGQKWGVRRFQNSDGSLTKAGQKRYGVVREAGEYAKLSSKVAYGQANEIRKTIDASNKRYGGEDGWKTYAKDAYGTINGKDYGMSQKEFERFMKEDLKNTLETVNSQDEARIKAFEETGKEFFDKANKWSNAPVDSLSKSDIAEAKALVQEVKIGLGNVVKEGIESGEYVLDGNVLKKAK